MAHLRDGHHHWLMFRISNIFHVRDPLFNGFVVGEQDSPILGNCVEEFCYQLGFFGEISVIICLDTSCI